jgi:hypothetical protein
MKLGHPGEWGELGRVSYIYISGWWFGTCFIFPYIGNVIIPTDELHHFSEGLVNHQPENIVPTSETSMSGTLPGDPRNGHEEPFFERWALRWKRPAASW